jgi:lipopolysaccharide/colanic/teichoic acid biosynthesis glycosyltransferase
MEKILEDFEINEGIPRPVEIIFALAGLILSIPVLLVAAIAIALTSRGPVLFRQARMGKGGRLFTMYKLRTMAATAPGPQVTARGDQRITPVGRLLRKTKIDELPELWHLLKGEMALVGPRPEVPKYVDAQNPLWRKVLQVRPGLTDPVTVCLRDEEALLAEVSGDHEQFYLLVLQPLKLKGYLDYLQRRRWRTDLLVLWDTVRAVISPGRAPRPDLVAWASLSGALERSLKNGHADSCVDDHKRMADSGTPP